MNIHNVKLLISAVSPKQYPEGAISEIALAGRSNVGKSSFINALLNRNNFARTSAHPGKTATINFYDIDSFIRIVDLPGYGYAEVSKKEREKWADMINTYLETRIQLKNVFLLVDSRHKPTNDDKMMCAWIKDRFGTVTVIATKTDKLSNKQLNENIESIKNELLLENCDIIIPFSCKNKLGRDMALNLIDNI